MGIAHLELPHNRSQRGRDIGKKKQFFLLIFVSIERDWCFPQLYVVSSIATLYKESKGEGLTTGALKRNHLSLLKSRAQKMYEYLTTDHFVERCFEGITGNVNECLHSKTWKENVNRNFSSCKACKRKCGLLLWKKLCAWKKELSWWKSHFQSQWKSTANGQNVKKPNGERTRDIFFNKTPRNKWKLW